MSRVKIKTATPATVRAVNRSILLRVIRLHQPVSRAGLSEMTGIFRSNVSEIVDELAAEGLVSERRSEPRGRGRVPILLSLNDEGFRVLGVSMRSKRTAVACAGLGGSIREQVEFPTPEDPEEFITLLEDARRRLCAGCPSPDCFRAIAVSVPGLVRADKGEILWIPSLKRYSGFPMRDQIESRLRVPVAVDNDCNLAALAEMWLSEDETGGLRDFVFLEIGEIGVGAGIVFNRLLYHGHDSTFAAEFGHMVVDPCGPVCDCGRQGCWETMVCDAALWRRYAGPVPYDRAGVEALLQAAVAGEERARAALEETARWLSLGISNIVFALNPDVVVLAGRLTKAWELVEPVIADSHCSPKIRIQVRPARLPAAEMFLHGAIHRALANVFRPPALGF